MCTEGLPALAEPCLKTIIQALHPEQKVRVEVIRETPQSLVLRCRGIFPAPGVHVGILKVMQDAQEGVRNHWVETYVLPYLPVQTPVILASGECGGRYWALFENVSNTMTEWTGERVAQSMTCLARVHASNMHIEVHEHRLASHTPTLEGVFEQLQRDNEHMFIRMLRNLHLDDEVIQTIVKLRVKSKDWIEPLLEIPQVLTHGDFHKGNILFGPSGGPVVIDWTYIHFDSPYFDIFQFMDATSPTQPLIQIGTRDPALRAYWDACPSFTKDSYPFELWAQGYFRYAVIHLMWILLLIDSDFISGKFPREGLNRQRMETIQGIMHISESLRE